ncbi:unnamed protein product [Chironomus riparius]|uniref:Uncharacterized protein n=1 Tax=Chironomus riparius TaxID=315576 RepID=A0A9N9RSN8_9DIPT|nr:unnamed protein product [Chironomus riparius]
MDKKVLLLLITFITATCAEPFIFDILYELFDSSEEYSWDNKNISIQCKNCSISVNGQQVGNEMTTMNGMAGMNGTNGMASTDVMSTTPNAN